MCGHRGPCQDRLGMYVACTSRLQIAERPEVAIGVMSRVPEQAPWTLPASTVVVKITRGQKG